MGGLAYRGFTVDTPWGRADSYKNLGQGLFVCSTPSHGGYFVPLDMLHNIPKEGRVYAAKWSGSEHWYEEDCAWAFVALAFTDRFPPAAQERARDMVRFLRQKQLVPDTETYAFVDGTPIGA